MANSDLLTFLRQLEEAPLYQSQIVHAEHIPARNPVFREFPRTLSEKIRNALQQDGIERLYSHQTEAIETISRGENAILATPTASGKTLAYNVPVFDSILSDQTTRALYIFPLKALTQDQRDVAEALARRIGREGGTVAIYDGDTSSYQRQKIRSDPPNILMTNPDMLHLGILPHHEKWSEFFRTLRFVIIDELQNYRGIFGCHVGHILRRLQRVLAHCGASSVFIGCTATIGNPKEHMEALIGLPVRLIKEEGEPQSEKHFVLVNPEASPYTMGARIFVEALNAGLKTIAFTKARKITELIYRWVIQNEPTLKGKISSYRAGFLPEERREIETLLNRGKLLGVIATSALESGVDIGGLDCCILIGYPGSIISTWQRSGRVGRRERDAVIFLIAQRDALDQYFMHHPHDLFSRGYESVTVDIENPHILKAHLPCAAAELALTPDENNYSSEDYQAIYAELEQDGRLLRSAEKTEWYSHRKHPHRFVDIRGAGEGFTIFSLDTQKEIGKVNGLQAKSECHPGAVYLHRGEQFLIHHVDWEKKNVFAEPKSIGYYTQVRQEKESEILEVLKKRPLERFLLSLGKLKVTSRITGFEKRSVANQSLLSSHPLEVPEEVFETVGLWLQIEEPLRMALEDQHHHFMGALHALEHTLIAMFPLVCLCDRGDLGGISYPLHPQLAKGAIFVYDGHPGGIGLTEKSYEMMEALLQKTQLLLEECPCEEGCPSCIHSPKCGSGNKPLDKRGALSLLKLLLGERDLGLEAVEHAESPPVSPPASTRPARPEPRILYFDLETQRSAEEVGGWEKAYLMGVSIAVIWDSLQGEHRVFAEEDIPDLIEALNEGDLVVGFNLLRFDYRVLSGYSDFPFASLPTFDILKELHRKLGYRLSLGHLAKNTLSIEKSHDGLDALRWWKAGDVEKVIAYCKEDVEMTRDLFQFGIEKKYLLFERKELGVVRFPVEWEIDAFLAASRGAP